MKVLDSTPVSMAEAKEIMSEREKKGELIYEQKLALEHLKRFTKLSESDAKKFIEELFSIIRMSPETAVQIVNLLPKTPDEIRLIFTGERFSLKEEEIEKIIALTKKYS
ncbi:MAG TPA: RNA polymerase Rpb4 family protein [archaeon]|nr:RNA polymerase Rpb4 family protein [archaeon]